MKIYLVFHTFFLNYVVTDPLLNQQQKPQKPVVAENDD